VTDITGHLMPASITKRPPSGNLERSTQVEARIEQSCRQSSGN